LSYLPCKEEIFYAWDQLAEFLLDALFPPRICTISQKGLYPFNIVFSEDFLGMARFAALFWQVDWTGNI